MFIKITKCDSMRAPKPPHFSLRYKANATSDFMSTISESHSLLKTRLHLSLQLTLNRRTNGKSKETKFRRGQGTINLRTEKQRKSHLSQDKLRLRANGFPIKHKEMIIEVIYIVKKHRYRLLYMKVTRWPLASATKQNHHT